MAKFKKKRPKKINFVDKKGISLECNECKHKFHFNPEKDIAYRDVGDDVKARMIVCPKCCEEFLIDFETKETIQLEKSIKQTRQELKECNVKILSIQSNVARLANKNSKLSEIAIKDIELKNEKQNSVNLDKCLEIILKRLEDEKTSLKNKYGLLFTKEQH